jgi:hypothetical protein
MNVLGWSILSRRDTRARRVTDASKTVLQREAMRILAKLQGKERPGGGWNHKADCNQESPASQPLG